MKKFILAFLTTYVAMFIYGTVWNVILFGDFYQEYYPGNARPIEEFNIGYIFISNFIYTAYISLVGRYFLQNDNIKRSIIAGFMVGFVTTQPTYLILFAVQDISPVYLGFDTVYQISQNGLGMILFAKIFFRGSEIHKTTTRPG